MTTVDDVTLKQFVESTWFKGLARGAMILVAMASTYIGATLFQVQSAQSKVASDLIVVTQTQTSRARDGELFQSAITADVTEVKESVDAVRDELGDVKLGVATMTGILREMQRRDLAQNMSPSWGVEQPSR
jgi:hypothetical protein